MKKFKKVFAVILSLAMVLGMSITSFATDVQGKSAAITIKNAGTGATFQYAQLITPNEKAKTGWDFVNDTIAGYYKAAFGNQDAQAIIKAMIDYTANPTALANAGIDSKIATALDSVKNNEAFLTLKPDTPAASPLTVTEAGVYYISGTEANYVYNPMAAYVSFGNYDATTGLPTKLENAEVEAKRRPTSVEKTVNDKVVEVGKTVEFTISSIVPTYAANVTNPTFIITDTITGADFVTNAEGNVPVKVYYGTATDPIETVATVNPSNNKQFTLDLSTDIRSHKEQSVVVKYNATVKEIRANNTAVINHGNNSSEISGDAKVYTAQIELSKTGENKVALAGAKFVVYKTVNNAKKYAKFNNEMEVVDWVDQYENANGFVAETLITTGSDGKATVYGFDPAETYKFKEVEAPEGYSLADDKEVDWTENTVTEDQVSDSNPMKGTISVSDTKLSSLPSTGGIGTTIFTIGGCAIMIVAAGLFFASRRRSAK